MKAKAYYIARSLFGYIEPPKVQSVGEQLQMEFERCKKSGGTTCEQQALEYVRIKNKSLRREPLKGKVIITRDYEVEKVVPNPEKDSTPKKIDQNGEDENDNNPLF